MYQPKRDYRFEYMHEALNHVEDNQCRECVFRKPDPNAYGPMCVEIEAQFIMEEPIIEIDDLGDSGLHCTKFRPVEFGLV